MDITKKCWSYRQKVFNMEIIIKMKQKLLNSHSMYCCSWMKSTGVRDPSVSSGEAILSSFENKGERMQTGWVWLSQQSAGGRRTTTVVILDKTDYSSFNCWLDSFCFYTELKCCLHPVTASVTRPPGSAAGWLTTWPCSSNEISEISVLHRQNISTHRSQRSSKSLQRQ